MLDIFALSVVLMAGYLGLTVLRRGGAQRRLYAMLLFADAAAGAVAYLANHKGAPEAALPICLAAVGAFVLLVMVPPLLRNLAGSAIARDRFALADGLLWLCEHFQPGGGAERERRLLATVRDVREGRTDRAIEALEAQRAEAGPTERHELDERITFTLIYARRWDDAVEHFETAFVTAGAPVSVQLMTEMVRAYCELGKLERAADLLERLAGVPGVNPAALGMFLAKARAIFLAFAGRPTDVETVLTSAGTSVPPSVRSYWVGVARFHAGDHLGAERALSDALAASAGDARGRQITAEALAAVRAAAGQPREPLAPAVAGAAERIARDGATSANVAADVPRLQGSVVRLAPVTLGLIIANAAVALAVSGLLGATDNPIVLADAGANIKAAVRAGDWWRLITANFLHVGFLHLGVNLYSLWILGRLTEQILGRSGYLALYLLSGLGGSVASLLFGRGLISAGASGAVFGVLGAAIADLALNRRTYPEAWRKALLGNLIFVAIANLAVGVAVPLIDQSAHVGGFIAGAVLAVPFSRRGRIGASQGGRTLAGALAGVALAAVVYAGWADLARFVGHPVVTRSLGGVALSVPARWVVLSPTHLLDPIHEAEITTPDPKLASVFTQQLGEPLSSSAAGWELFALGEHEGRTVIMMRQTLVGQPVMLEAIVPTPKLDAFLAGVPRILESAR